MKFIHIMLLSAFATSSVAAVACDIGPGVFQLYYQSPSTWSSTYLHYNAGPGWNSIPGLLMTPSDNASWPASSGWVSSCVSGNSVTWVTTNGGGSWDNNGGKNYAVPSPGLYSQQAYNSPSANSTFPSGCALACVAPFGSCAPPYDLCNCSANYFGATCSATCPGSPLPCDGHGSCSSEGQCVCTQGWASCGGSGDCSTDVSSDPYNCGGCGVVCLPDPAHGVINATCGNATCTLTCAPGYVLCPDGTCNVGNDTSSCGLPGCDTFSDNQCSGNNTETPSNYTARMWQAPARGEPGYVASFQDYAWLQGYVRVLYEDVLRTSAVLSVYTVVRNASRTLPLTYSFDGVAQSGPNITYCAPSRDGSCVASNGPVSVNVTGADGSVLTPPPVYLLWGAPPVPVQPSGDYRGGQKGAIVEMFGWPHAAVAQECANLSAYGYLGAKTWPVSTHVSSFEPFQNALNPWFFLYQPASYSLDSRMGSVSELADMISTCRRLSVRMYADAVVNHMVGAGNDAALQHRTQSGSSCVTWDAKNSSAGLWYNSSVDVRGVAPFYTQDYQFAPNAHSHLPPSQEFAQVPYSPVHFHCERPLNSWTDPLDLNAGWLDGLVDLNTEHAFVQQRIADYFTSLLSVGFSGFRIDAAKHIQPDDHVAILSILRANMGGALPDDFVTWMEVLTGGEGDMLVCTNSSGYNYGGYLENALLTAGWPQTDVDKIKIWASYYPKEPQLDCGNIGMNRKAIQNDDADQQTSGSTSRDMGNDGCVLVMGCATETHRQFEVTLFSNPYGVINNADDYPIRMVLSSFWFNAEPYGFPDGFSDCARCLANCDTCQNSMPYTPAYDPTAPGYSGTVYTRVHRDAAIVSAMRQWMQLPALS